MVRRFSVNFAIFSILLDMLLVALALWTATYIRPSLSALPDAEHIPFPLYTPSILYVIFPPIWAVILMLLSVYDGRRNIQLADEFANLTLASLLAMVSLAGMLYLSYREVSRLLFIVFFLLAYAMLLSWRLAARSTQLHLQVELKRQRHVLIIGLGPLGCHFQEQVQKNPLLGLMIVGFLDDHGTRQDGNPHILGSFTEAVEVIQSYQVDDVVIALPYRENQKVNQLIECLHNQPVKLWVIPEYFHVTPSKTAVEDFDGIPLLDLHASAINEYQRSIKRGFDLLAGLFLMVIFLPLMGAIAVAIRLDSPGPILYKQRRVGENGRLFWMVKFRSMCVDADERFPEVLRHDKRCSLLHKVPDDPRVTRVGKLIRRTSMDELPQIFNVLFGDMSLVGPRPELPYLVNLYEPWQRKRFEVPQGMTGWWQVNGRSDRPMHLNTEDDLYYVQNYSLLLDIQILLKTAWVVLLGKGAY